MQENAVQADGSHLVSQGVLDATEESVRQARQCVVESRERKSTGRVYSGYTKHWDDWCNAKAGDTLLGVIMDESKEVTENLVLPVLVVNFFQTFVFMRPKLTPSGAVIPNTHGQLGEESIKGYQKALQDLQEEQRSTHPQKKKLNGVKKIYECSQFQQIIKARKATTADRRRQHGQHIDIGKERSAQNVYSDRQHHQLCTIGLFDDSPRPPGMTNVYLRCMIMTFMHALKHQTLLRGDSLRKLHMVQFFLTEFVDEGPHKCYIMTISHDNAKSNSTGKIEFYGVMRHLDQPEICSQFHAALYFLFLFRSGLVELPKWKPEMNADGSVRSHELYSIPTFIGLDPSRGGTSGPVPSLPARTANKLITWAVDNIQDRLDDISKKEHLERCCGANQASEVVSEDQVRRAGSWRINRGSLETYLKLLPKNFIRSRAGFPVDQKRFYIARAVLEPPPRLQKEVFGFIIREYESFRNSGDWDDKYDDDGVREWIEMLEYLAVVLVQDLAVLYEKMKKHVVFSYEPFSDDTYGFFTYRESLFEAMRNNAATRLQQTAQNAHERGDERCAQFASDVLTSVGAMLGQNFMPSSGAARAAFPTVSHSLDGTPRRQLNEIHAAVVVSTTPTQEHEARVSSNSAAPSTPRAASPPTHDTAHDTPQPYLFQQAPVVVNDPSTWPEDPDELPPFVRNVVLCDKPRTIRQIYTEYKYGLNGGPALKSLEEFYGPSKRNGRGSNPKFSWRSKQTRGLALVNGEETVSRAFEQSYARRADLCHYIDREIEEGQSEAAAISALQRRVDTYLQKGQSSSWTVILKLHSDLKKELRPESYEANKRRAVEAASNRAKKKQQRASSS